MIDKKLVATIIDEAINSTDLFVVDIRISDDNDIVVELDSPAALDLDTCTAVSRHLDEALTAAGHDDFSLEVGSAGITSPLKVRGQYVKNIGHEVEIVTRDGRKLKGIITAVSDDESPLSFTLEYPVKVKEPGAKRPVTVMQPEEFDVSTAVKSVVPTIDFK